MQYNILKGALCEFNITEGNIDVDYSYLYNLSELNDYPIFDLTESGILVLDIDMGHRINLSSFEYKFISSTASMTELLPGIKFYVKDESFDDYVCLTTLTSVSGIFYTTISGIFAPRYLRLKHTMADTLNFTTITGSVYGLQILNNDSVVDFGVDGSETEESLLTYRGSTSSVRAIPIYNSGSVKADAYINLEPDFSPIDQVVYISDSSNGPWIRSLDTEDIVVDEDNYDSGIMVDIDHDIGPLRIAGAEDYNGSYFSRFESGIYTSPIINKNSSYCRLIVNNESSKGHISVDANDPTETIEIRSSNTCPQPYAVIREVANHTINSVTYLSYRDRWLRTQVIKEDSPWCFLSVAASNSWNNYWIVFDQLTERWAGFASNYGTTYSELYLFNNLKTSSSKTLKISYHTTTATSINFSWRELKLNSAGGIWIYFYCQSYHSSDFVYTTGYYLAYLDDQMNVVFKVATTNEEINVLDVDYSGGYAWYTKPDNKAIYKINTNGDVEVNYSNEDVTYQLGGIAVLPNGNLLFANDKDIHRLKYNGIYLSDYFIEDVAEDTISCIALDGDGSEAIWVIDGDYVGRVFLAGENKGLYDFKIELDYPVKLTSVEEGVWVQCVDIDNSSLITMVYISKENRRADVNHVVTSNSKPGLIYQTYTNSNYIDKLPIATDTVWSYLEWSKAATKNFLLFEDQYYQLRINLRRQTPIERYPEFITDAATTFICDDNFDSNVTIVPNKLIWSDWANYPNTDRVYVNTSEGKLVFVPEPTSSINSFITTQNRYVVGLDSNNELDIRLRYTFGEGDGVVSGKAEYLYLYLNSASPGHEGHCLRGCLYIPPNPVGSYTTMCCGYNNVTGDGCGTWLGATTYDGEIRIYWNGSTLYGQRRDGSESFVGGQRTVNNTSVGNYFSIYIASDKNSSQLKIDYVNVYRGNVYYYADSPLVPSIYEQKLLEVNDIYPNNYKNIYLKTDISNTLDIASNYDMDMKVRWRIPIY